MCYNGFQTANSTNDEENFMALRLNLTSDELQELSSKEEIYHAREHWREPTTPTIRKVLDKYPGFQPNNLQATQVAQLVGLGLTAKDISASLLIDPVLLKFYYKRELEVGSAQVNAKVAHVALKMALTGESPTMTQFWLSRRAGWKETTVTESTVEVRDVSEARNKLLGPKPKPAIEGEYTEVVLDKKVEPSIAAPSTDTRQ